MSIDGPRRPTGLVADVGRETAFLDWNYNLESNLTGYAVLRDSGSGFERVARTGSDVTEYTDNDLSEGRSYRYAIVAIDQNDRESPLSNEVVIQPGRRTDPIVEAQGPQVLRVDGQDPHLVEEGLRIRFGNGHTLLFDVKRMRVRDWQDGTGTHLLYPGLYGNAIDIVELNKWGFPEAVEATAAYPATPPPYTLDYTDLSVNHHRDRGEAEWKGHTVRDGRITLAYSLPLRYGDVSVFMRARVWETWYESHQTIGGVVYSGLNRKIELQVPSFLSTGYSLCLNEAIGINGSCNEAVTYDLQWANPYLEEIHWDSKRDMGAQNAIKAQTRVTNGFHPSFTALQVHPLLYANYPDGVLLLTASRFYHAIHYRQTNYARFSKDGLWPNFMVDCATSGRRFAVETFRYLHASRPSLAPPQLYMDAAICFRRRLAELYHLKPYLTSLTHAWAQLNDSVRAEQNGAEGSVMALGDQCIEVGADMIGDGHQFWFSAPYTVSEDVLHNREHPINQLIKRVISELNRKGVRVSYWVRPDFVKNTTANVLSTGFDTTYYGYLDQEYPEVMKSLNEHGLPMVREHPEWLRRGADGSLPNLEDETPYQWTPVLLSSGWYEEVMLPTLRMMKHVGISDLFQDGGISSLGGVEYCDGDTKAAMPYYWRWFTDAAALDMAVHGECPMGWGNNTLPTPTNADGGNVWALVHSVFRGNIDASTSWVGPRMFHAAYSVYGAAYVQLDQGKPFATVNKAAQAFLKEHGHPDRVVLDGLRWGYLDASGRSPVQGWIWDDVFWEYMDGRKVRYPRYSEVVDLATEQQPPFTRGVATTLPAG